MMLPTDLKNLLIAYEKRILALEEEVNKLKASSQTKTTRVSKTKAD